MLFSSVYTLFLSAVISPALSFAVSPMSCEFYNATCVKEALADREKDISLVRLHFLTILNKQTKPRHFFLSALLVYFVNLPNPKDHFT